MSNNQIYLVLWHSDKMACDKAFFSLESAKKAAVAIVGRACACGVDSEVVVQDNNWGHAAAYVNREHHEDCYVHDSGVGGVYLAKVPVLE
jgi:hypothetical protein